VTSDAKADAPVVPGERRRSRERALELLYEAESKGVSPASLLSELLIRPERYATELVLGVSARAEEIDALIERHATDWTLARMPVIDRQLLRVATFELIASSDVPTAVVLDEAIELAKAYSTENSGRFVNGVLSSIARETRQKSGRS
jgi:N utilization substance protein B